MTQAELGKLTGHKAQSVARHETGENQLTVSQMEGYAKALRIKPEELLNTSARMSALVRELAELIEALPRGEQQRAVQMMRAFAEPRAPYTAEQPAPARPKRAA